MGDPVAGGPRRLTLVVASLESGGAERAVSELANAWASCGREVTVVTLHHARHDFYTLHTAVTRVVLDVLRESASPVHAVWHNLRRMSRLRRAIVRSRPDCVIAFNDQTNVATLIATAGLGCPVVVTEQTDPRHHQIGSAWTRLRRWTYPRATRVVVQTRSVAEWAATFVDRERLAILPNPLPVSTGVAPSETAPAIAVPPTFVVAMGRLVELKGFHTLIESFAIATKHAVQWHLVIMGEGPERSRLEALASTLGVANRVHLPGNVTPPAPVLARAQCFVLASRYEGFANALVEAMSVGCPVVSTACQSGPTEIITDGVDGLLVPVGDVSAMADAIHALVTSPERRAALGQAARGVNQRFSLDLVLQQWDSLLGRALC